MTQKIIAHANGTVKLWQFLTAMLLATITIVGSVSAFMDTKIDHHNNFAKSHEDIRVIVAENAKLHTILTEVTVRQIMIAEDIQDIKARIRP